MESSVNSAHQHGTDLPRRKGGLLDDKKLLVETVDNAIGRFRIGLTTKIHALADGKLLALGPFARARARH